MRTIKELLQLMLDNQQFFSTGLCNWEGMLAIRGLINDDEDLLLSRYIRANKPSIWSSIEAFKHREDMFWWEEGNIKPRIKWLRNHIKKNS